MKFEKIDQRDALRAVLSELLRMRDEQARMKSEIADLRAQIADLVDPVISAIRAYIGRGESFTCSEILNAVGVEKRDAASLGQRLLTATETLASVLDEAGIGDAQALARHLKSHGATSLKATKTGRVWTL